MACGIPERGLLDQLVVAFMIPYIRSWVQAGKDILCRQYCALAHIGSSSSAMSRMSLPTFMWIAMLSRQSFGCSPYNWLATWGLLPTSFDRLRRWCLITSRDSWRPGMGILALAADERVKAVRSDENTLSVDLMDGRTITVPLAWYPRLFKATQGQRDHWGPCAAGYGIHWPDLDEDLSTEGLLRGAPAPSRQPQPA